MIFINISIWPRTLIHLKRRLTGNEHKVVETTKTIAVNTEMTTSIKKFKIN